MPFETTTAETGQTPIYSIQLTGWKAAAAAIIILALPVIRLSMRFPTVTDEGQEALRAWLVDDYEGLSPGALAQAVSDYQKGLPLYLAKRPAVAPRVEFASLAAHRRRNAMIVRAEVTVDGQTPPDGRRVRYLYLGTMLEGGWKVLSESDSYRYYEMLFR